MSQSFLKAQGAKILSELNDLKRTVEACAKDLSWKVEDVQSVINGSASPETCLKFRNDMCKNYPIDPIDLTLIEDDCSRGVKIMRHEESVASARVFQRSTANGELSPYYEYRDTALSRLSLFRPEWIEQLREVKDNNPENPDVIYNNGHFMHQITFFVGPVNFYYEVDGRKYCQEMNTGDSNYITPFWPHSFASRSPNEETYIVAVTFGAEVKKSLRELYNLGPDLSSRFVLSLKETERAAKQLLDQHISNERLTPALLQERLDILSDEKIDLTQNSLSLSRAQLEIVAKALNITPAELEIPRYVPEEEVVVKRRSEETAYHFPESINPAYKIYPLARCLKMSSVKAFEIEVLDGSSSSSDDFSSPLHQYIFNYSNSPVRMICSDRSIDDDTSDKNVNQTETQHVLSPGDSAYLKPFIRHRFVKTEPSHSSLFVVGIPGTISQAAQKELSAFADFNRVVEDSKCWFNE